MKKSRTEWLVSLVLPTTPHQPLAVIYAVKICGSKCAVHLALFPAEINTNIINALKTCAVVPVIVESFHLKC